ncbi:MAG: hypothetical protein CMN80_00935 [Spongiibacter sp.]|uniref:hypothetical protein n=1 Tax=Spongiibacter sp. TaxID=2024860 RepID=UPI000C0A529B|nr:hypothetical protein [Spongiibacter sp.]MAK42706.1 hypothetical protein [Spongiibacter sp.]|tara:strand:+ start:795 stop:1208 length:414 start_codon:yes stop_codon:yes gene_type:complete
MSDEQSNAAETADNTEQQTYENLNAFAGEPEFIPGQGGEEPQPDQPTLGGEELAFIFQVGFGVVASRRGDHWKIADDEAQQLGAATDAVLQKYLPDIQTGPEVALVLTAGMVFLPRIMTDQQLAAEAEKPEAATDGD